MLALVENVHVGFWSVLNCFVKARVLGKYLWLRVVAFLKLELALGEVVGLPSGVLLWLGFSVMGILWWGNFGECPAPCEVDLLWGIEVTEDVTFGAVAVWFGAAKYWSTIGLFVCPH